MSDQIVINVITDPPTNINITDTGENVYLNPLTLNQGIINHSVTHQAGGSDELSHNLLGGLQGGTGSQYYHLTQSQYNNLVTGAVVRPSETGQFYPSSNPSGFITGVDLSNYATTGFVTGASGFLQNQISVLNNQTGTYVTGEVVRPSQTGQFYPANNPSGFITGVDLSNYATIPFVSGISGDLQSGLNVTNQKLSTAVFVTGNQDISGLKDFQTRPTVLDIPVLVSGDAVDTIHLYGKNDQGATIYKGQPVYINSANGANPLIQLASNTGERTSSKTIGLLAQDLAVNEFGYVITEGLLEGFNTSAGNASDPMWLGPTGNIIYGLANKPYGNNHLVYLGIVLRSNNNNGRVYVKVQNGFEIDELHKVYALNPSNKDTLLYNSGSGAWFARQLNTGDVSGINNYVLNSTTGQFYPSNNPSGFITGIDLTSYATNNFVTGISGGLQTQISSLNSQTGSYVTGEVIRPSQTGQFYAASNPSGFITTNNTAILTNKTIDGSTNTITNVSITSGISGLGTGVATFLASPTSDNLRAVITNDTGTDALVFANMPTLISPNIGAATGDSLTVTGNINASGTTNSLPNQTLSSSDDARILTKKTSARDDMWSVWQKRWLIATTTTSVGASFGAGISTMAYSVNCGTASVGRAGAFSETGLTLNQGQGAAWSIPSSFAVAFGFFGLFTNTESDSSNVTNNSNTFTVTTTALVQVGQRIFSSAFPEETYVSAINGTTITATKNAITTPTAPHRILFTPDQISRVVLGTINSVSRIHPNCPNCLDVFGVTTAKNIGDTSLQISPNIRSVSVAAMWSGQPYFILTTANASITPSNATTLYASCTNFPSGPSAMNVLRIDNAAPVVTNTIANWNGSTTPTNQITVSISNNISSGQTVSGPGIPHNTTVLSVSGNTVTLNQAITSDGAGVIVYFGYQRVYVDQNATATATSQACGFIAKTTLNQYIYGRGISSGTTISNIQNITNGFFDFVISSPLTKAYANNVTLAVNLSASNFTTQNNCIFMDYSADPSDGYLKVRLGYMKDGLITYSPWTSFPKGNVPSASYNCHYQAVIDYNSATDKLRLFVDRNGDILSSGGPRDWPKPPSTPTITMTGVSGLENKATNISFGAHIYGNDVNSLSTSNVASLTVRQMVYYPYQTFID